MKKRRTNITPSFAALARNPVLVGHNQSMLDFGFGVYVLTILRLNRRRTSLGIAVSLWLWLLAGGFPRACEPGAFLLWLSAAAWANTLAGLPSRSLYIFFVPLLVPLLTSSAGLAGLLTGIALNLSLPRKKNAPSHETYGITRVVARFPCP